MADLSKVSLVRAERIQNLRRFKLVEARHIVFFSELQKALETAILAEIGRDKNKLQTSNLALEEDIS